MGALIIIAQDVIIKALAFETEPQTLGYVEVFDFRMISLIR